MSNLIPIHLAEAAMAERDAEIARLKDELKMEKENEDRLVREFQRANNEVYGLQRQVAALIDNQTRLNSLIANSEHENARLKAECQARQAENSVLAVECDSLKAEVERLTKAGDELHAFLINYIVDSRISSAYLNKLDDGWNAAKEGKPQS